VGEPLLGGGEPDDTAKVSMKHVLTKALGAQDDVDFEVIDQELNNGDVLLLCSDGLTNMVSDRQILEIVATLGPDPPGASDALVREANAQGGRDNISVILVRYGS